MERLESLSVSSTTSALEIHVAEKRTAAHIPFCRRPNCHEPPEVIVGRNELSRRKGRSYVQWSAQPLAIAPCTVLKSRRPSQIYNSLDDATRDDLDASRSAKVFLLSGAHITGSISVHFIRES